MREIQLLTIKNVVAQKKHALEQVLSFFILVENKCYDKQVEVIWAREDGVWHTLAAHFHSVCGENREYWLASVKQMFIADHEQRGNIQVAVRLQAQGLTFWDNHHGLNYISEANAGLTLVSELPLLNVDFSVKLTENQHFFPVTVAVDPTLNVAQVLVHWTIDNWQTVTITPCHARKSAANQLLRRPLQQQPQSGAVLWKGRIKLKGAFRLQYCISCVTQDQAYWDNNAGLNYIAQHPPLKVMILNLHCYQEEHQDYKFSQIARAINDTDADIVCLQEVAELWNNGAGDWPSNAARIINERLKIPYQLYTDWSHLGFDQYREGVAILSRYPMLEQTARYVSNSHDVYSIHSRKVAMAQIPVPGIGLVNVFSAHLSWWEDGFAEQFKRLGEWAAQQDSSEVKATLLCGDFNITAGSIGYDLVVKLNEYDDQFLAANAQGVFDKIFRVNDAYWQHYLADDYRIDYIFMNKTSALKVISGSVLFTEQDYGRVSDHCGYLMSFEPR